MKQQYTGAPPPAEAASGKDKKIAASNGRPPTNNPAGNEGGAAMMAVDEMVEKTLELWVVSDPPKATDYGQQTEQQSKRVKTWPYEVKHGRIIENQEKKAKKDEVAEIIEVPLCNFDAKIVADIASDDGEGITRKIQLSGRLDTGAKLPEIVINASEFEAMQWPVGEWGGRVSVEPNRGVRDKLRHAIQRLSQDSMVDRKAYAHTGWRVIDGKRVFLHAGGAIGGDNVDIDLPKSLHGYVFPSDDKISKEWAMAESIKLLNVAPTRVSAPLWAAMFLAPLSEIIQPAFTVSNEGGSGSLKSSFCAVLLNHFGAGFSEYAMPADWLATANTLERLCFHAKDVPLIIDDFRPTTSKTEGDKLHDAVSRIVRAAGNRQGRGRLDGDSGFKPVYQPRGVVMMTAERRAVGKSVAARVLTVDTEPGDVDPKKLADAQKQRHVYAYAMRGYIQYVADNWDKLSLDLPALVADVRAESSGNGQHKRLPNATAVLYAAFCAAMDYAAHIGVITGDEAKKRKDECKTIFQNMAESQNEATEAEDPALKYLTIIATLIAQNKAFLSGKGENVDAIGLSESEKLGWHDGQDVYLLPGCYNTVYKYARDEGWSFPSDENTLRKELDRGGYITKRSKDQLTSIQRTPGGNVRVTAVSFNKLANILCKLGIDVPGHICEPEAEEVGY